MTATMPEITREFLDFILPTQKDGYLIVAVGSDPHVDTSGKYGHNNWHEKPFHWPDMADAAVDYIQHHTQTSDVYICPYLMKTPQRTKGNAAYRALVHCDVDGDVNEVKVYALGGIVVWSGTTGHGHVYIILEHPVTPEQHAILERLLVAHLGGDSGKVSENDLLRPPGTFNHKSVAKGGLITFVTT